MAGQFVAYYRVSTDKHGGCWRDRGLRIGNEPGVNLRHTGIRCFGVGSSVFHYNQRPVAGIGQANLIRFSVALMRDLEWEETISSGGGTRRILNSRFCNSRVYIAPPHVWLRSWTKCVPDREAKGPTKKP